MTKRTKQSPRQRELRNRARSAKRKNAGAQLRQGVGKAARHHGKDRPARPDPSGPAGWKPGALSRAEKAQPRMRIADIKVGKRHRKDMGDIRGLALDFNERGLLQPIVVGRDGGLIAGERRLLAWQHPDHHQRAKPIPVHVVPVDDIIAGEWAENDPQLRKDFTPSEAVAIKKAIEAKLKPAAMERMRAGKKAAGERAGGRAASFTGKSRRTIEKAEAIVAAAEAEPAKYGKLKDDMDKSGRVDGPFKRLQTMRQAELIRKEPSPLPRNGPYRAAVIDFPWAAEPDDGDPERLARGYYPYATMSQEQIVAFAHEQIRPLLHDDCVVALWITNFHLARGDHVAILEALDAKPVTIRTWVKDRMGRGQVLRGQTEHAIIAKRGKPTLLVDNLTTFFHAAVDKKHHSRKPQKFYGDLERLVPAPRYVSFFETADRGELWDGHGDKAPAKPKLSEAA